MVLASVAGRDEALDMSKGDDTKQEREAIFLFKTIRLLGFGNFEIQKQNQTELHTENPLKILVVGTESYELDPKPCNSDSGMENFCKLRSRRNEIRCQNHMKSKSRFELDFYER